MAYFVNESWQLLMKIQTYAGVWPNQNRLKRNLIRITLSLFMISAVIPPLRQVRTELSSEKMDLLTVVVNITGSIIMGVLLSKLYANCIYIKKSLKIYEKVNGHFRTLTDPQEAFVLKKYSENAAKYCVKYICINSILVGFFMFAPTVKMLFNFFFCLGEFERILPYVSDYGIFDDDQYYVLKLFHIFAYCICTILSVYSYDFAYMIKTRYVSALFEIVKIRLEVASSFLNEFEWDLLDFETADNKAYEVITTAIDLHNEALEIFQTVEATYSFSLLLILLLNTICYSSGAYALLIFSNNLLDFCRYFSFLAAMTIHFFALFSHGQRISDASSSVSDACYNVHWYVASKKTKMLLLAMMKRSYRPCQITGGRLFPISMESYGKMLKAGISYYSVFKE